MFGHIRGGNACTAVESKRAMQYSQPGQTLPIVSQSWIRSKSHLLSVPALPGPELTCSAGNWHQPLFWHSASIGCNPYLGFLHLLAGVQYLKPLIIGVGSKVSIFMIRWADVSTNCSTMPIQARCIFLVQYSCSLSSQCGSIEAVRV